MKTIITALLIVGLVGALCTVTSMGKEAKKVSPLMKKKLERSQKVLEGIALGDFEGIARNAEELIAISKEAQWRTALKSPRYEVYSNEFRRVADNLIKKAEEKNIDGAALAYVELTLTCVRCHKHVREIRMARK